MIAWIEGVLREKEPTRIVLDVSGVGYELLISLATFAALPDVDKTVALQVRTVVREDALLLYGFASPLEKAIFDLLCRANRVGPKLAQTILSGIEPDRVLHALAQKDHALLCRAPGVGKKLAERMAVELCEPAAKLREQRAGDLGEISADEAAGVSEAEIRDQVLSALINLGYPKAQAERVVEASAREAGEGLSIEDWIRIALRRLAR